MSQPFFTVIVPAYGVQGFLRACMDSILEQSFGDFELIAVDDRSPDHCGAILDSYAEIDPRVTVIHLEENVGLGPARQVALERATGKYVLFVDSDDWITPGSFEAIAKRLAETDEPEILIFDYERVYWNGRKLRNVLHEYFARPGPEVFAVDERPELLTLLMVVWNKAYRRDFITEHGFRFPSGYYEDTPWTYPTLLSAHRIALLDRVCVEYRQRRTGNILRNPGRKHFDVFEQYARVFAFIDADPELERWRTFMVGRMMQHLVTILSRDKRIGPELRHEFFDTITAYYRKYNTAEPYERPSGRKGMKFALAERGHYWLFAFLLFLVETRKSTRRRIRSLRTVAHHAVVRPWRRHKQFVYWWSLRRRLDDKLAVYAAYWYHAVSCNPYAIYLKAKELAPDVRGVWIVADADLGKVPPGVEVVRPRSAEYYRVLARAKYVINNVNFPNEIVKRPGSVHVQTHHGTPLKSMGLDLQAFPEGAAGMGFTALLKRCDRWDISLSSNAFTSEAWEHAYPGFWKTFEAGYPRNDALFGATEEDVRRIRADLGIKPGAKVVLYATTHREYHDGFQPVIDLDWLADELGPDYVILTRTHYYYREGYVGLSHADVIDVSAHPVVEELYLAADVLITDYSSVMFDYANLDRPIIIYAPDWERYRDARGTYFDLFALPPGVVTTTPEELVTSFRTGAYMNRKADVARAEFRRMFCQYDDGHAAERVVRHVFLGEDVETAVGGKPVLPAGVMGAGTAYGMGVTEAPKVPEAAGDVA